MYWSGFKTGEFPESTALREALRDLPAPIKRGKIAEVLGKVFFRIRKQNFDEWLKTAIGSEIDQAYEEILKALSDEERLEIIKESWRKEPEKKRVLELLEQYVHESGLPVEVSVRKEVENILKGTEFEWPITPWLVRKYKEFSDKYDTGYKRTKGWVGGDHIARKWGVSLRDLANIFVNPGNILPIHIRNQQKDMEDLLLYPYAYEGILSLLRMPIAAIDNSAGFRLWQKEGLPQPWCFFPRFWWFQEDEIEQFEKRELANPVAMIISRQGNLVLLWDHLQKLGPVLNWLTYEELLKRWDINDAELRKAFGRNLELMSDLTNFSLDIQLFKLSVAQKIEQEDSTKKRPDERMIPTLSDRFVCRLLVEDIVREEIKENPALTETGAIKAILKSDVVRFRFNGTPDRKTLRKYLAPFNLPKGIGRPPNMK
jgi:hypothetical protein